MEHGRCEWCEAPRQRRAPTTAIRVDAHLLRPPAVRGPRFLPPDVRVERLDAILRMEAPREPLELGVRAGLPTTAP